MITVIRNLRGFAIFILTLMSQALYADVTAFVDVSVLTMTDRVVRDHFTVVVDGPAISAVGPVDEVKVPDGATVIQGEGRFLMPGLIDLHVHVNEPKDLILYPAHGVTTVVNLGGWLGDLDLREDLERGLRLGPRYLVCGPPIVGLETPEQAVSRIQSQSETGYDCIKIYNNVSFDVYDTLAREAKKRSMISFSHIPRNLGWRDMLQAKPDAVAHAEEFLYSPVMSEDVDTIATGLVEGQTSLIATLVTYDTIGRQVADLDSMMHQNGMRYASAFDTRAWGPERNTYLERFEITKVPELRRRLAIQDVLIRRFHEAGVRILLGTDGGGVPFVFPGSSALEELHNLVDAGLDEWDALRAGTSDAAEFLGLSDQIGTISVGRDADLVLLMGDPTADIENVTLQAGTMVRGRWLDRSAWRSRLADLEHEYVETRKLVAVFDQDGPERFVQTLNEIIDRQETVPVSERTINELGYELMIIDKDLPSTVSVFELNTRLHPASFNAWDSLGEAYREAGRTEEAIEAYGRSFELNPKHEAAKRAVAELRASEPD